MARSRQHDNQDHQDLEQGETLVVTEDGTIQREDEPPPRDKRPTKLRDEEFGARGLPWA